LPLKIKPVKSDDQEHHQVETTVKHNNEETHLNFLEKPITGLHINKYETWSLNCDKLVLLTEDAQLASWVQLEVVSNSPYYLYGW